MRGCWRTTAAPRSQGRPLIHSAIKMLSGAGGLGTGRVRSARRGGSGVARRAFGKRGVAWVRLFGEARVWRRCWRTAAALGPPAPRASLGSFRNQDAQRRSGLERNAAVARGVGGVELRGGLFGSAGVARVVACGSCTAAAGPGPPLDHSAIKMLAARRLLGAEIGTVTTWREWSCAAGFSGSKGVASVVARGGCTAAVGPRAALRSFRKSRCSVAWAAWGRNAS